MKSKIIKSILFSTLGMLSTSVVIPMLVSSCGTTIPVESVSIDKKSLTLSLNESEQLTATVLPENATNKSITWASSDPKVATVNKKGQITTVSVGKTTITITTKDGGFQDSCEVNVVNKQIPVESVSIDGVTSMNPIQITIGQAKTLHATVLPENATNKNVIWSSNKSSTVSVHQTDGWIVGYRIGTATITATTVDGTHTATCEVKVVQN